MTKTKHTLCRECRGFGYTPQTSTEYVPGPPYRTVKQGSGCPKCYGTGKESK